MIGAKAPLAHRVQDTHTRITIYSRPDCHLCDDMKAVVIRVATGTGLTVEHVDITGDAELEARYGLEIPVLVVDGKKAAKYRITEGELTKILSGREPGRGNA